MRKRGIESTTGVELMIQEVIDDTGEESMIHEGLTIQEGIDDTGGGPIRRGAQEDYNTEVKEHLHGRGWWIQQRVVRRGGLGGVNESIDDNR